ncbi:M28 family peptidase [bacterium]|jgi:hypothetical protein|nr:M28 family peptidase [bacterium]
MNLNSFTVIQEVTALTVISLAILVWYVNDSVSMPQKERGISEQSQVSHELQNNLKDIVVHLAQTIGHRNVIRPENLKKSAQFIEMRFNALGYETHRESFHVVERRGYEVYSQRTRLPVMEVSNIVAEKNGSTNGVIVVGAHYDSVIGSPGADDNATGVAALLELSRLLFEQKFAATLKFIAFVNEEPPYFQTDEMGSYVSAKLSQGRNENIIAMISLESLGFYTDEKNSQKYPAPLSMFYPDRGNFVSFVSNRSSRALLKKSISAFRDSRIFPSEGACLPEWIQEIGFSDQWSYWQFGFEAIMVTAFLRNPYYHTDFDTPEKINYDALARIVVGMVHVLDRIDQSANRQT